jgi:hypothetical protein
MESIFGYMMGSRSSPAWGWLVTYIARGDCVWLASKVGLRIQEHIDEVIDEAINMACCCCWYMDSHWPCRGYWHFREVSDWSRCDRLVRTP